MSQQRLSRRKLFSISCLVLALFSHPSPNLPTQIKNSGQSNSAKPAPKLQLAACKQFLEWLVLYPNETALSEENLAQGIRWAHARRVELERLIQTDPQQALAAALPEELAELCERLPQPIRDELETHVCGRGDFEVHVSCSPGENREKAEGEIERTVDLNGMRYRAFVYGRRVSQATKYDLPFHGIAIGKLLALHENPLRLDGVDGLTVKVGEETLHLKNKSDLQALEGQLIAQENQLGPYSASKSLARTAVASRSSWTTGNKTILMLRVDFSDQPGTPLSDVATANLVQSASDFWFENSYGRTTLAGTVPPLLRMPQPALWYRTVGGLSQLQTDARAAAKALGAQFDTAHFDLDAVLNNANIGTNAGLATLGAKGLWLKGDFSLTVFAHELGHNLGLQHSNGWFTNDGSVIGAGYNGEYGDVFDMMGGQGTAQKHYNPFQKNKLDWLPNTQVATANGSGQYRIYAHDLALGSALGALKVPKDSRTYWISFRQQLANVPYLVNGAEIHWSPWSQSDGGPQLLNIRLDPQTGVDNDRPLPIGYTFSDLESGIYITPIGKGGTTPESLDVVVNKGDFSNNFPPSVTLTPSAVTANIGQSLDFTATGSDPDGDALAYFWEFGDQSTAPSSPVVSKSWAVAGDYIVRCTVSDMKGGRTSAWVVVKVGSPPVRYSISGHVYDQSGHPVEGVKVTAMFGNYSYSDSQGAYSNVGLFTGAYNMTAAKYNYSIAPGNFTNAVTVNSDVSGIDFTATILVPVNNPPVAAADIYATPEDQVLSVNAAAGLLANDQDWDGDALSAQLVSSPAVGVLKLQASGAFTYTPPADYSGPVTFQYRAQDGALHSLTTTVTINVSPVNDAPTVAFSAGNNPYGQEGVALNLTAAGSDVYGTVNNLVWNFGDGSPDVPAASGASVPYTYANPGVYTVTVYAVDNLGLVGTAATMDVWIAGDVPVDGLYLSKGAFRLNWAVAAQDTISLTGSVNPARLDFSAGGPTVSLAVNGTTLFTDTFTLTGGPSGAVANLKAKLSPLTGAFSLALSGLTALDVGISDIPSGESVSSTQDVPISMTLSGGGLAAPKVFSGLYRFGYTNRGGELAKGAFAYKKLRTLSGIFQALRTTATEEVAGGVSLGHRLSASGVMTGAGSAPTIPSLAANPAVKITVGDPLDPQFQTIFSLTGGQLLSSGDPLHPETTVWTYNPSAGAVPGLLKFSFSNAKKTFSFSTSAVTTSLDSSIGGTITKGQLLIRVEVYTALAPLTPLTFETVVELLRSSPTATGWKR